MKIRLLAFLFTLLSVNASLHCFAQETTATPVVKVFKVGIFAPVLLDSLFSVDGKYRYKQTIPKSLSPAIDFLNGAQIALDSLQIPNTFIKAFVFDTRAAATTVPGLIKNKQLDSFDLLIGSVKDFEYKQLADFALSKNIPFISATYPNDGGITANPFTVIVNSTLKAHCEAIYSYILQNHGTDKIYLLRKHGTQEDKVASYFKMINEPDKKPLLNIQTILIDSINSDLLEKKLDSNRQNIIIGGSLEEGFAADLTNACFILNSNYNITLLGMPNWDGFKSLQKKEQLQDFPIYYTTPYFNTKLDSMSNVVANGYLKKYKGKPTDMVYKGFEATYLFTRLLAAYPDSLMNHLNEKDFKVFSDYNFRPVMLKKESNVPDYFENKHLYFIKMVNGTASRAW